MSSTYITDAIFLRIFVQFHYFVDNKLESVTYLKTICFFFIVTNVFENPEEMKSSLYPMQQVAGGIGYTILVIRVQSSVYGDLPWVVFHTP